MNLGLVELGQLNKKYAKKRPVGLIVADVLSFLYVFIFVCYFVFCCVFIQAEVVGASMQPTFNSNLSYSEDANKSVYKDIVYANRFQKGTNGDIVLVNRPSGVAIKRIIATSGQQLSLRKIENNVFRYYLKQNNEAEEILLEETYLKENSLDMDLTYFNSLNENLRVWEFAKEIDLNISFIEGQSLTFTIPKNTVFVLGDNRVIFDDGSDRIISEDSSVYGPISTDEILGKVSFYYEYNQNFLSFLWQQICSIF